MLELQFAAAKPIGRQIFDLVQCRCITSEVLLCSDLVVHLMAVLA